jgi:hypothetical protein
MTNEVTSKTKVPEAVIDEALDVVLRASGSALRHYTMPKTVERMRIAMLTAADIIKNAKRIAP